MLFVGAHGYVIGLITFVNGGRIGEDVTYLEELCFYTDLRTFHVQICRPWSLLLFRRNNYPHRGEVSVHMRDKKVNFVMKPIGTIAWYLLSNTSLSN